MSKITNLIGTTWRLDGDSVVGVPVDYGTFNIVADVTVYGIPELGQEPDYYVCSSFICGIDENTVAIEGYYNGVTYVTRIPLIFGDIDYLDYVQFTITGGTDISNPLFIDFINTYGTLVSGGEPPTAEGVKEKLQSLLTASNAKTGKSDANLTDAVTTLIEGYKQGITPSGSLDITENGTFDVTDKASVNVNVPVPAVTLQEKTAMENGEVLPDSGYDGLSKVVVAIPEYSVSGGTEITDLAGTKWQFNNKLVSDLGGDENAYIIEGTISNSTYSISLKSSGTNTYYSSIYGYRVVDGNSVIFGNYRGNYGTPWFRARNYTSNKPWSYSDANGNDIATDAPIIEFTGGASTTNATLIAFVKENATKIGEQEKLVRIQYNGETIESFTGGGTKTLECKGKVMTDDIKIIFTDSMGTTQ